MDENFKKEYGIYDGISTKAFKHIPEISCYNFNYYIGLKRDGFQKNDLLFAFSDDDFATMWYVVNVDSFIFIGYDRECEGILHLGWPS